MPASVGVLMMENRPLVIPGAIGDAGSWDGRAVFRTVPGAWVARVLDGDRALDAAFVATARDLAAEGCELLVSNCGFSINYQRIVAEAVDIPVLLSPLLGIPSILAAQRADRRLGLLTYDARLLDPPHLAALGLSGERLAIAGIEGTRSWERLRLPQPDVGPVEIEADVLDVAGRLLAANPDIVQLLLECGGFPPYAPALRKRFGLPVHHLVTLARGFMEALA